MGEQELIVGDRIQLVSTQGGAGCDGIVQAFEGPLLTVRVSEALFHKTDVLRIQHVVHDDARYALNAIVEQGGAPRLVVKPLGEWVRIQQREYVRLRLDARVFADVHADPVGKAVRQPIDLTARVIDLSAGGLQLETEVSLHLGDRVFVRFELPDAQPIATTGVVVRVGRNPRGGYRFGLRFVNLAPALETQILRWIYEQQALKRRRTLA